MGQKILVLIVFGCALALSACNTVNGLGEDIKSVGETADRAT